MQKFFQFQNCLQKDAKLEVCSEMRLLIVNNPQDVGT